MRRQIREQPWFRRRVPNITNPLTIDGLLVYHDTAADPTIQALAMGAYEPETVSLFTHLVRPGMTVLDVGAHIGYFTLLAARAVGATGRVYAFEPLPSNATQLRRNVEANGFAERVIVVEQAVTDQAGEMCLHDSGRDAGTATLYSKGGQSVDVTTISLDGWAEEHMWPRVDLMKMDVEGAEVAALAGMRELKRLNPQMQLLCEFNPTTLGYAGLEPSALLTALPECGFEDVSIVGAQLKRLSLPADIPRTVAEARKWDLINLYCR
jgi:FkbM family methyltransferase